MNASRMLTITERLRHNHARFRQMLCDIWAAVQEPNQEGARWAQSSLEQLIRDLWDHEAIEEGILLPEVLKRLKETDPGIFEMFKRDHRQLAQKLHNLQDALMKGGLPLSRILAENEYEMALREHMEQEERVYFPLVEKILPLEVQKQILEQAEAIHPWRLPEPIDL